MKVEMIAMDLDGTLLMEDHLHISERNKETLLKASREGIRIVIASGRPYVGIQDVLEQLPFADYALTCNGAVVVDVRTGELVHKEGMDYEQWKPVYDILKHHDILFEMYVDGKAYMEKKLFDRYGNDQLSEEFVERLKANLIPMDDGRELFKGKPVEKIASLAADPEGNTTLKEELEALPGLALTSSIPGNLEINSKTTNKGCGLAALCDKIGIRAEQVMAFGDAGNDLEMLAFAGWSYAMENASPQAKEAARFVTASNKEDGVAVAVEAILNNKA